MLLDFDEWCNQYGWEELEKYLDYDDCSIEDDAVQDLDKWLSDKYNNYVADYTDYSYEQEMSRRLHE